MVDSLRASNVSNTSVLSPERNANPAPVFSDPVLATENIDDELLRRLAQVAIDGDEAEEALTTVTSDEIPEDTRSSLNPAKAWSDYRKFSQEFDLFLLPEYEGEAPVLDGLRSFTGWKKTVGVALLSFLASTGLAERVYGQDRTDKAPKVVKNDTSGTVKAAPKAGSAGGPPPKDKFVAKVLAYKKVIQPKLDDIAKQKETIHVEKTRIKVLNRMLDGWDAKKPSKEGEEMTKWRVGKARMRMRLDQLPGEIKDLETKLKTSETALTTQLKKDGYPADHENFFQVAEQLDTLEDHIAKRAKARAGFLESASKRGYKADHPGVLKVLARMDKHAKVVSDMADALGLLYDGFRGTKANAAGAKKALAALGTHGNFDSLLKTGENKLGLVSKMVESLKSAKALLTKVLGPTTTATFNQKSP